MLANNVGAVKIRVQIDYLRQHRLVDRVTGKCRKTQLFCAVLPFTFGEFAWSQNLPSFIESP